ncbi:WD40 repeat-containing protein HOS15 isoform X3 [Coffea arabica]|uniref:WD40 repeat-containing protein HOS15 isoform X3 n=1 Tax=Coffea arabica TaxID=13443 RepID=A0ABM4V1F1_COFAR
MASITSVELNYLIFRYLQESGFTHSAFAFGYEACINKCQIDGSLVPPGALVTFVQKGLQYLEMEANLSNVRIALHFLQADSDVDEDYLFLQPLDLITKDVYELRRTIKERRKNELKKTKEKELDKQREEAHGLVKDREKQVRKREREKETERTEEKPREKEHSYHNDKEVDTNHEDQKNVRNEENGVSGEPMEISTTSTSQIVELTSCDVTILEGHTSEVCACAWSPSGSLLASGSGDSTARIWRIGDGTNQSSSQNGPAGEIVLLHVKAKTNEKSKDVTAIDWNIDGTLLATGSYDGQARIWSTDGELKSTLTRHKGPIFSLKWNKKCDYIVTGSCDKTAVVWDVKTEGFKQQFEFHSGPILDVDWRNNVSFATSSTDHMIYVCKIGETSPIKTFSDHQGEVNCLKWDPTGTLLASCSDDVTAKIWSLKQDKCVHDFKEHDKEIYTIRWSPTGPGTNNPNLPLLLASASFDSTVKLWDVEQGRLLCSLTGHREPVYSVAFSPNGEYLASGSLDKSVLIWSLKESKIIKRYTGNGGIFEVCWNKEGDKIAACFANNVVCVLDFRR